MVDPSFFYTYEKITLFKNTNYYLFNLLEENKCKNKFSKIIGCSANQNIFR